ncbi:uncharacterized protein LOC128285432 [Gossypium arboreum]|uniref:uncharacterized protein LOC128285432 n=1 Tax=Gossypium arboreum TaxID=29729 RepID=UPI0022F1D631|nr:uncharacterized protein LOC128285432 [Gossypium arboreum]
MILSFDEFDVILGMDLLTSHGVIVDCGKKSIELKCKGGDILRVGPSEPDNLPIVISSMTVERYLRKGYVFLEELLGLPPTREVEFGIKLIPGKAPISIAPYGIALMELKELKMQLQELTDRGFARPSYSPWGAPMFTDARRQGDSLCLEAAETI